MNTSCSSSAPTPHLPPKLWIEQLIFSMLAKQSNECLHSTPPPLPFFFKLQTKKKKAKHAHSHQVNDTSATQNESLTYRQKNNKKLGSTSVFASKNATRTCAMYLRVLDLLHENLTIGQVTTIRDIYYHDVTLFQSQQAVNKIVTHIAHTYGTPRECFNVKASPKGLACGSSTVLTFSNGLTVSIGSQAEVVLIPNVHTLKSIHTQDRFVLVIEKEATFQSLVSLKFHEHHSCLLITGKGFPDINTKRFVNQLYEHHQLPIYFLMDGDPYGIHIYLIYNEDLKVGRYLGIEPQEIIKSSLLESAGNPCLPLSFQDRQRGYMLLRSKQLVLASLQKTLSRTLQYMLFYNMKMEIQALTNERLITYLEEKLFSAST